MTARGWVGFSEDDAKEIAEGARIGGKAGFELITR